MASVPNRANSRLKYWPGEFSKETEKQPGFNEHYEKRTCKNCGSDALVVNRGVGDVSCESCGKWQSEIKKKGK